MPTEMLSIMTIMIFLAVGGGLVVLGVMRAFSSSTEMTDRIKTYAVIPETTSKHARGKKRSRFASMRMRLNTMLSSLNSDKLALELLRADWRMTVTEFLLIRFGVTAAAFLLGWFISGSIIPGIGMAAIAYLTPGVILRWRISRRQIQFDKQLLDVLVLINGAVRAGFSLMQAIEIVAREMKPPASDEFRRVLHEASLGVSLPHALRNLTARMRNSDLDLVVTAIEIQYKVGGNLATMLSSVSETIRERIRLFGEVRVITTQQRYTGYLLSILPFVVGALMFIMNPDYMMRLFEPGPYLCIPIGAVIGIIAGHFVIQRIAKIEV
ncbi:MAG: secretion system protein [Anaerolineales bacterium]|nr:secretion system protein [Anaerolineales bacterium]